MAEENGLEVMDQLEKTPVSSKAPQDVAGLQTLTTAEEDRLSTRFVTGWMGGAGGHGSVQNKMYICNGSGKQQV